ADFQPKHFRRALIDLFEVLDTPDNARDPYMEKILAEFPYVNGGLFADNHLIIPTFSEECVDLILNVACPFSWEGISPTIFGAVFESTLSAKIRRSGGMHYTSLENIHKVIDPLFLNDLQKEYEAIAEIPQPKVQKQKLEAFQDKLAGLKFFDPACGSGNFLTETYISLRRLENKVIDRLTKGQIVLGEMASPVKVNIHQFYGIEINDFACVVAKTAMWIAELQMMQETQSIVEMNLDFLPLKSYVNIVEGNALRRDWQEVLPPSQCNYIMGNPPFVGYSLQSKEQKADMLDIYVDEKGKSYKTAGKIDYVAGWYFKAAEYMQNTDVRAAFVSTNSITQGEQVAAVWKPLYDRFGIHIDFAWRTFIWNSESNEKAHVHCVIIGFGCSDNNHMKNLYELSSPKMVKDINPYLVEGKPVFIEARRKPICDVPVFVRGSQPTDDGNFIFTAEEKNVFLAKEPQAEKFIRPFMMGKDFIDRKPRYCLWLVNALPQDIRKCPEVMKRVTAVREFRLNSKKPATQRKADTPTLFDEVRDSKTNYIALPKVSSQNRRYIPMDFLSHNIIAGDKLFMLSEVSLYHFGVLMSNVHMAWMRVVAGRLKSDYSYSNTVVYNNFPWPTPTDAQKAKIEKTAQGILDARAKYPDSSLADLYDEVLMPPELRKAHQANDRAVMEAYGFWGKLNTESECVAQLMKMYQKLVDNIEKKK
ncbi:MAG: DNA methyltransferase, partial [Anaerovibrio sp.]|nr:DNA methyltransferase [Anaerovibrio sp.]